MFDNSSSFEEATKIDQLIYQLAAYEIANGYIMVPKDMDETYEYQSKIANKFNHFKRLIQNGEMTILELSSMVTKKNGPYYLKKTTVEEDIDAMTGGMNTVDNDSEYRNDGLIQQIFRNLIASNGAGNVKFVSFDQKTLDEFDAFNDKVNKSVSDDKKKKKKGRNSGKNKTYTKNDPKTKKSQ
jgi:hypothetical protein